MATLALDAIHGEFVRLARAGLASHYVDERLPVSASARTTWHQAGQPPLLVSWYRTEEPQRARVSIIDPRTKRYRHVLLVRAKGTHGDFEAVATHAGGIAMGGADSLYVADTHTLLRFDLRFIFEADDSDAAGERVGRFGDRMYAVGSKYVLFPEQRLHPQATGCSRIARYPLTDNANASMSTTPSAVYQTTRKYIQGAVALPDRPLMTSSFGEGNRGSLFVNPFKGRGTRHAGWPEGVEDLSYNLRDGRVWSVTEFASKRAVFAVPVSRYK